MQLHADTNIDSAIAELQRALPIAELQNIVARRSAQHKAVAEHQRVLCLLKAKQIVEELRS